MNLVNYYQIGLKVAKSYGLESEFYLSYKRFKQEGLSEEDATVAALCDWDIFPYTEDKPDALHKA